MQRPVRPRTYCAVDGCKSQKTMEYLSFFSLPRDEQRRHKWVEIIGRPDLLAPQIKSASHVVCSLHFDESMMKYVPQLKPDAVPTKLLPNRPSTSNLNTKEDCKNVCTQTKESFLKIINVLPAVTTKGPSSCLQVQIMSDNASCDNTTQTVEEPKIASQTVVAPGTSATAQQSETTQQHVTSQQGVTTQSDVTLQIETTLTSDLNNLPEPKTIIARVYDYFQNEYETLKNLTGSSCELNPLANYLARTAEATGVNEQTVTAILEEREREKVSAVKKKETRKRKRVKKDQQSQIDDSPIAEEPPCETTDHHADVDHQIDEEQQMEQEDSLIETLKVEVDEEYDPAMTARITTDPLVTEMHSTVYQMFSTENVPNVGMKTVPVNIKCPSSTSAAVIPQVTAAGEPFLMIKTEPIDIEPSGTQTQIQSCVAARDPLEIVQGEPSSHDKSQCPGQPSLPD